MIFHGIVRSVEKTQATIELESAPCDTCRTPCGACGQIRKQRLATVENTIGAKPGDAVQVECKDKSVLFSSVLLFVLPLVAGIVTVFLCLPLGQSSAAIWGLVALAATFLVAVVILSSARQKQKGKLRMLESEKASEDKTEST